MHSSGQPGQLTCAQQDVFALKIPVTHVAGVKVAQSRSHISTAPQQHGLHRTAHNKKTSVHGSLAACQGCCSNAALNEQQAALLVLKAWYC